MSELVDHYQQKQAEGRKPKGQKQKAEQLEVRKMVQPAMTFPVNLM